MIKKVGHLTGRYKVDDPFLCRKSEIHPSWYMGVNENIDSGGDVTAAKRNVNADFSQYLPGPQRINVRINATLSVTFNAALH